MHVIIGYLLLIHDQFTEYLLGAKDIEKNKMVLCSQGDRLTVDNVSKEPQLLPQVLSHKYTWGGCIQEVPH